MKKIRRRSPAPFYGVAILALVYVLIFPLYRLSHFFILAVLCTGLFLLLSKLFPGKIRYVCYFDVTGNAEVDELLQKGAQIVTEMTSIRDRVKDPAVKEKLTELSEITANIYSDLTWDPGDYSKVRRFDSGLMPPTMKLLRSYDTMSRGKVQGENISASLRQIRQVLDTLNQAFEKQYDALFADQSLDIETDIQVLEALLKRDGLGESDFNINTEGEPHNG